MSATRMIAIWCPDWPVTAAQLAAADARRPTLAVDPTEVPAAVFTANRVVACSHSAREAGVRRGLRRREAQARCPELTVLTRNEAAEARAFEPVVLALESLAPGVEVTRPGLAAIGVRGPTRYFGGEAQVLHVLSRSVAELQQANAGIGVGANLLLGVADGSFAAEQAARRALIVPAGESADFLAPLSVRTLDPSGTSALVDLLLRLGLRTLGAFAALPPREVLARFGSDGAWAHRQAGGRDDRPVAGRRPPAEFTVTLDFEPAVDRVDTVAFSARASTEKFVADLADNGLACTCFELQVLTENGTEAVRRWRHAGVLSSIDVLDRIRWQLEGWMSTHGPNSGGVTRLCLVPLETVPTGAHQQALWGGSGANDERAHRALARVQTLLGHGSVLTAVVQGGRDPLQRTGMTAWGDEPTPLRSPEQPWPGHLPAPAPSVLFDPPRPAQVLDVTGRPVTITPRGTVPSPPAHLVIEKRTVAVTSWAGPWPVDERWWSNESGRQLARFQLVDVHGRAYLVGCEMLSTRPSNGLDAAPRSGSDGVRGAGTTGGVSSTNDGARPGGGRSSDRIEAGGGEEFTARWSLHATYD
ncbi:DNA polymerase Y family protein [Jatrophihabitans sp. GAS493]|uniref:DNA polymerase Y family protein n=1 Tax=Jatrophihabitans sp. GAS493 TaxID=1907575 RepID=UPI00352A49FD